MPLITAPTAPAPSSSPSSDLPDAPSEVALNQDNVVAVGEAAVKASGKPPSCNAKKAMGFIYVDPKRAGEKPQPCSELVYPYQRFLGTNVVIPLTWQQKGYLALHDVTDPGSLATIALISGITTAADPHSAYGPGLKGWGKNAGVSLLQNATAEFFGTFAVPSIMHQDPRYYRRPDLPFKNRLIYSISRTIISRHDDGSPMPNYGTLFEYPINAELSNLYVPGIESDGASTVKRILVGYAIDPTNNILAEFLPDVAKHVRIRIIFIQQFLNNIAANPNGLP
ncbi:hypothetical protein [Edaphobacter aggregans]|nr:hypothetical protein [Edaphobacter aggregans]